MGGKRHFLREVVPQFLGILSESRRNDLMTLFPLSKQ